MVASLPGMRKPAPGGCDGDPVLQGSRQLEQQNVVVRSSNYALYADMSQRMMALLEAHCEELEIYSIDEAFGRLSRPPGGHLQAWAQQLRTRVRRDLGLPIAIGLGASKSQAKLANHLAKASPDHAGIFDLTQCRDPDPWLESMAIEDVWEIGRRLGRWCRLRGIANARQFRDMPSGELKTKAGVVGLRLQRELRGDACLPLTLAPAAKRETCVSRSFSRPITSSRNSNRRLPAMWCVRLKSCAISTSSLEPLTVYTRTSPFHPGFYSQAASRSPALPSNDTGALLNAAMPLVQRIFQLHRQLAKAGVLMQHLQTDQHLQHHLMAPRDALEQDKRDSLMHTIDRINQRHGRGSVQWAACGLQPSWAMRRERLSGCSTTRLNDVPIVHADR